MTFEIKQLSLALKSGQTLLHGLDFHIAEGEIVGLVGESGSGKSLTGKAITRLNDEQLFRYEGEILFQGENILNYKPHELRNYYRHEVSMIFQDPQNSLNPLATIKSQLGESLRLVKQEVDFDVDQEAYDLLLKVGFSKEQSTKVLAAYPFELSGGMQQRVMIAIALAKRPSLLIADEPTTALDVTIQANIIDLLKHLNQTEALSLLFITHDLSVARNLCDRIIVMKAGTIVEMARTDVLFSRPLATYTLDLFASIPGLTPLQLEQIDLMREHRAAFLASIEPAEGLIDIENDHWVLLS